MQKIKLRSYNIEDGSKCVTVSDDVNFIDTYYISKYQVEVGDSLCIFYGLQTIPLIFEQVSYNTIEECIEIIKKQYSDDNFEFEDCGSSSPFHW